MKVVLLGYMASGKSTIGQELANKLFLPFIDLDRFIEKKEGKSIPKVFANKGEIHFRKLEHKYLSELLNNKKSFVLSLGGGTPCYFDNMNDILKSGAKSVYLSAKINTLKERILRSKTKRPLVADINDQDLSEFIAKHLFERRNDYERANIKVTIDNKKISQVIDEIWLELH